MELVRWMPKNQQPWRGGKRRECGIGHVYRSNLSNSSNVELLCCDCGQPDHVSGAFNCPLPCWSTLKRLCDNLIGGGSASATLSSAPPSSANPFKQGGPSSATEQPQSFVEGSNDIMDR